MDQFYVKFSKQSGSCSQHPITIWINS